MATYLTTNNIARVFYNRSAGYLVAVLGMAAVVLTVLLFRWPMDSTIISLALLIVVLVVAVGWGSWPAFLASGIGVVSFHFLLSPLGGVQNTSSDWFVLTAFLITAIIAGQLSARAKQRTEEAILRGREVEQLYTELRAAFERASSAEAVRRSELLKSSLLDTVTHNLRTPLTSIKAAVTTLHNELPNVETSAIDVEYWRELLDVALEESDRLNRFVEGLVEVAQIESGQLGLRRAWGPVEEIVNTALSSAQSIKRGHEIEVSIEENLPPVNVDPRFMAEVIYTLIDNATKYAPPETPVRVSAMRAPNKMIRIAVEDEGRGIPEELREQVFEKFYRSPTTVARESGRPSGIGMGLTIARGIVEAHGGKIWVETGSTGRGARLVFDVPINDEENPIS